MQTRLGVVVRAVVGLAQFALIVFLAVAVSDDVVAFLRLPGWTEEVVVALCACGFLYVAIRLRESRP